MLVSHRDEFHERPTAPADWWEDHPDVLGGRDLAEGGTWLGVDRHGRLATLTNFREPGAAAGGLSRGRLVADYLRGDAGPAAFARAALEKGERFAGFNLLLADPAEAAYAGNRAGEARTLAPGVYGLSNHHLDTPWPKVRAGRERFRARLEAPSLEAADLLDVLEDRTVPPDHELPDTGVGPEKERLLGASFIVSPDYGTRAATAVIVHREGAMTFVERTFSPAGEPTGERRFDFRIRR